MRLDQKATERVLQDMFCEVDLHFAEEGAVHECLRELATRLRDLEIPFALAGDMAMFHHGYRRFTDHVQILVCGESLAAIHRESEGRGYVAGLPGRNQLRDAHRGVRIDFFVSGDYPGNRKPKPLVFPNPVGHAVEINKIPVLRLPELVELKLASGMSSPGRIRDLADAQELIRELRLPAAFSDQLNPYVRGKFIELWDGVHQEEQENPG